MKELKVMDKIDIGDRAFTRILGGFSEDSIIVSDKQIADLLGYSKGSRQVRVQLDNNIKHFEEGLHIIDLKGVPESDRVLHELGYSKQSITQSKHIYAFSHEGFLLYLQIADIKADCTDFERLYFGAVLLKYSKIRHEHCFGELLKRCLKDICNFTCQYTPNSVKHKIDFYEPNFNLAIEYDEEHHTYNYDLDNNRQKEIENILGCKFIRIKKGNEIEGINYIIKEVLELKRGE